MTDRKIDAMWFNEIGIVRVTNPAGEYAQYYIGQCGNGTTEEQDTNHIADWGTKFPTQAGDILFLGKRTLMYNDITLYGDEKSLTFVEDLIKEKEAKSVRRSAMFWPAHEGE